MALALVWTGEHYVADIVVGWIYCVAVYVAIEWAIKRWERRRVPAEEHLTGSEPELEPTGAS